MESETMKQTTVEVAAVLLALLALGLLTSCGGGNHAWPHRDAECKKACEFGGSSPYRETDLRCEEQDGCGERCMLPIGHHGMHVASGGSKWIIGGDSGPNMSSGGNVSFVTGDTKDYSP